LQKLKQVEESCKLLRASLYYLDVLYKFIMFQRTARCDGVKSHTTICIVHNRVCHLWSM